MKSKLKKTISIKEKDGRINRGFLNESTRRGQDQIVNPLKNNINDIYNILTRVGANTNDVATSLVTNKDVAKSIAKVGLFKKLTENNYKKLSEQEKEENRENKTFKSFVNKFAFLANQDKRIFANKQKQYVELALKKDNRNDVTDLQKIENAKRAYSDFFKRTYGEKQSIEKVSSILEESKIFDNKKDLDNEFNKEIVHEISNDIIKQPLFITELSKKYVSSSEHERSTIDTNQIKSIEKSTIDKSFEKSDNKKIAEKQNVKLCQQIDLDDGQKKNSNKKIQYGSPAWMVSKIADRADKKNKMIFRKRLPKVDSSFRYADKNIKKVIKNMNNRLNQYRKEKEDKRIKLRNKYGNAYYSDKINYYYGQQKDPKKEVAKKYRERINGCARIYGRAPVNDGVKCTKW